MKAIIPPLRRILLQILLLLGIYALSRGVFAWINRDHFTGLSAAQFLRIEAGAVRFDLSAVLTVNALYFILFLLPVPIWRMRRWEQFTQWLFILINAFALLFEVSDWGYFPFNLKRSTLDVFNMVSRKGDFLLQVPHFIRDYWFAPVGFLILLVALMMANRAICRRTPLLPPDMSMSWIIGLWQTVALVLVAGFSLLGIRGGWQMIPIGNQNAIKVAGYNYLPVVLNTPFSIIHSYSEVRLEELHYYDDQTLKTYIDPVKEYRKGTDTFRRKNVVYLILESFSKEYTGLGGRISYTPFLDSLMQHAYVCTNAWANSVHSAEGVPAVLSGVPSLMSEAITTSPYGTNHLTALPSLLKNKGYESAFYHGGSNGTMSFDIFASAAGFDHYYGRREYNDERDYDGSWGIWDEPFLQYFAAGVSKMKEPFVASVFTLSSHDPSIVPDRYKDQLPTGPLPLMQSIAYTDMAVRKFFAAASRQTWYQNTLFVLVPDHAAPLTHDSFYSSNFMGRYAIPIVFFAPGDSTLKGKTDKLMQQIDILPSVLDYLHYDRRFFALGNSVFQDSAKRYLVNGMNDWYSWRMGDYLITLSDKKPAELFYVKQDSICRTNIIDQDRQKSAELGASFQAFLQCYHDALIHDRMWVDP